MFAFQTEDDSFAETPERRDTATVACRECRFDGPKNERRFDVHGFEHDALNPRTQRVQVGLEIREFRHEQARCAVPGVTWD